MSSYKLLNKYISVMFLYFHVVNSCLEVGFYDDSCDSAEIIVRQEVQKGFENDKGVAAGLLRLHFHDCFVRGCDGSVLLDSTPSNKPAEKNATPNQSLRPQAFDIIDKAKASIETYCPGVVSCADILAFAARDSIWITGGSYYNAPAGRKDGNISLASEALSNLPSPTFNLTQLTQSFAHKGLTQDDMVTLSGAHTIGQSRCASFANRLYNFISISKLDPSLDPKYAAQLKQKCPKGSNNGNLVVPMDTTPTWADFDYYEVVQSNKGLFTSDQALLASPQTRAQVLNHAKNPYGASGWYRKFGAAMVKMGNIGVLTGNDGEIRANCRKPNGKKKVV